jgi:hypothetical protein
VVISQNCSYRWEFFSKVCPLVSFGIIQSNVWLRISKREENTRKNKAYGGNVEKKKLFVKFMKRLSVFILSPKVKTLKYRL